MSQKKKRYLQIEKRHSHSRSLFVDLSTKGPKRERVLRQKNSKEGPTSSTLHFGTNGKRSGILSNLFFHIISLIIRKKEAAAN